MTSFTLEPIFGATWPALLITGLTGVLFLLVRPNGSRMNKVRTRVLLGLRMLALLLILLAMLRPSMIRTDNRPAPASLVVLADHSRSMTLTDGEGSARFETQSKVLSALAPALASLDNDLEIKIYKYGKATTPIALDSLNDFLSSAPDERQTDLAQPLRTALAESSGKPLAGVVMIGDGTSTIADSNPGSVARNLAALDVPLWTVPIGPPAGDSQTRDVAVEQLAETFRVFSKNVFRVSAAVDAKGLVGRDLSVSVKLVKNDGAEEELATRVLIPTAPSQSLPLDVEIVAPAPGSYRLEVEVAEQDGETITANNQQVAFLDVREGGGRIFYIEGEPRLEQLFLRRSLDEATDFLMTLQLAPQSPAKWPTNVGPAFNPGQYDVIVLGDLPANALGNENLETLVKAVENGAGLLMIGGQRAFDAGGYANTPLARILPVQLKANAGQNAGLAADGRFSIVDPVQLKVRRPHPITRLGSGGSSNDVWSSLKPLVGANRFAEVKPDPTVEVLLESSTGDPILVVGGYGSGRIALFAGDTTWQWWRQGKDEIHRRFWRQVVLWLLSRDGPEMDTIWVRMDSRRFQREQPAKFYAGVQQLGDRSEKVALNAEVLAPDGSRRQVPLVTEAIANNSTPDAAMASGTIPDLEGGIYKLRVFQELDNVQQESAFKDAEILFQVVDVDAELSRPMAEIARLEQLAALTSESGGKSYRPDEVESLLAEIKDLRTRSSLPVVQRMRFGEGPISGWLLMIAFTGLLSSEWYLRKRWGLA